MTKIPAAKDPTRNVWLQRGSPDAEEQYLKAELVLRLDKAIKSLGLTQRVAARRIGATQPELSKILRGKFSEVSLERLMRFLTALGYHIEIKIGARKADKAGDVTIKDARRSRCREPGSEAHVEGH
jgi:predicted XRE-type DNA-binding protein